MRVYRIARQKWIKVLSGSGIPARWNTSGARVLYTSSSLALALLEILVHLRRDQVPDYMWVSADIRQEWIDDWSVPPGNIPANSAEIGPEWLGTRGGRLALAVPSVIVPEKNYLLNPDHTGFSELHWSDPQNLIIDPRLTRIL
jgi:RES domain-containing protein